MKRLTVLAIVLLSGSVACIAGKDGAPGPAGPAGTGPGGETASSSGGASSGAPASSSGAPASSSSGGEESSSSSGSSGTPAAPTKIGSIMISQTKIGDNTSFFAMASFTDLTGVKAPANPVKCTVTKDGDCDISVCDIPKPPEDGEGDDDPPPAKKAPTASDVTITANEGLVLEADADTGMYTPATGQAELFAAGDDLKIKAKGDKVPAFNKTLKAPSVITLTDPTLPDLGDKLTIDRTAAFPLAWDDGTVGDVTASITSITDKKVATISCKWAANKGKGSISKAAMGKLLVSETAQFSISTSSATTFDQGGWKITLSASAPGGSATATIE